MAPYFLEFGAICGLRIVNGISRFPLSSDFTFVSQQGCSTIDYLLALVESASKLVKFKILELQPESCHRPLVFHLNLFVPYRSRQAKKSQGQRLILDSSKMDLFRLEVESLLSTKSNMLDLVEIVAKASTRVFPTRLCSKHKQGKEWYDKNVKSSQVYSKLQNDPNSHRSCGKSTKYISRNLDCEGLLLTNPNNTKLY